VSDPFVVIINNAISLNQVPGEVMMTGNAENVMERIVSQVQSNILATHHEEPKIHRG
jgi:hypothetical protein